MLREYHGSEKTHRAAFGRGWTIVGLAVAGWVLIFAVLYAFQVIARTLLG